MAFDSGAELAESRREFARDVVVRLRSAGHEALFAGGCVRDLLMNAHPVDYDVATSAHPQQVRELFGFKKTLAVGAAFGVIIVQGPTKRSGQVEVATFRNDAKYSDGRRPDAVTFSTAEEDARRRDFTINGMFYDPIEERLIDYVGGQEDLRARVIRAIGNAHERIGEDKLRMMRAVRFAARFGFEIEPATRTAIAQHAADLRVVSGERLAVELRKTLTAPGRAQGLIDLATTHLLRELIPQLDAAWQSCGSRSVGLLRSVSIENWVSGLAAILEPLFAQDRLATQIHCREPDELRVFVDQLKQHLKLANEESEGLDFALRVQSMLDQCADQPWSVIQPFLINPHISVARDLFLARAEMGEVKLAARQLLLDRLAWPREQLDPPPLLTGQDLQQQGLSPGPRFRELLSSLRSLQLDGVISNQEAAIEWLREQVAV